MEQLVRQVLGRFDPWLAVEMGGQILLSLLLGGMVGWDRERRHMPAGVRTYMLVSFGSCVFTILSHRGFPGSDPARVAAQIVVGVGFLGAGLLVQRKGTIYGLTSAAGIWAVAAVGMAVGTGRYFVAVFSALAVYIVLAVLRRWFKAELIRSTRRTLNTALRDVRAQIQTMGRLVARAITSAVQAALQDDHLLAYQVVEADEEVNQLRYQVEETCIDILRTHNPQTIQLRTVLAATTVATNLERIGDYAKEIAQVRLDLGHEPLVGPVEQLSAMAERDSVLIQESVRAFAEDDVEAAERIRDRVTAIDQDYDEMVDTVIETMTDKKTRHFARGAGTRNIAYHLKRTAERVTNIAERIVFVRTGALAELETEERER
jgi:phosphate transport system regulatory protein PhoU